MFPLTEDKFLLPFLGKTLLEHQLTLAIGAGLAKFILVCNPKNQERVRAIAGNLPGASVEIAVQAEAKGIADGLECAAPFLTEELLIINPNDIFDGAAYSALLASRQPNQAASILGYRVSSYFPGGYLVTNERGILKGIVEKPGADHEPSDLVNLMVHWHTDPEALLRTITRVETTRDDVYECALDLMCKEGKNIRVVPYAGAWHAIKYPWHILDAVHYFLDQAESYVSPTAQVSPRACIEGKVVIGDNVRVLENAVIRGPVYIGPGSIIGNSTLVRAYSHLGTNCVVGFATEIKGSYISEGSSFHMNYVGDSIVGANCNLGAGTITANWRFDEQNISVDVNKQLVPTKKDKLGVIMGDNCRTGINASLMPGIKIGPNSIIGPGIYLTDNVDSNTMLGLPDSARPMKKNYHPHRKSTDKEE